LGFIDKKMDSKSDEKSHDSEQDHIPSSEENHDFYKMYKDNFERNQQLLVKFQDLLNKKFDLILEMSCLKKGERFQKNEREITEELEAEIEEYNPEILWLINLSKSARENIALLKRTHEIEQEIEEMQHQRDKLAAQVEYRMNLGEGKKMKRVPFDEPFSTSEEGSDTSQLFRRLESRDFVNSDMRFSGQDFSRDTSYQNQIFPRDGINNVPFFTNIQNQILSINTNPNCLECGGSIPKSACSSCNQNYTTGLFGKK